MLIELIAPILVNRIAEALTDAPEQKVEMVKTVAVSVDILITALVPAVEWVFRKVPTERRMGLFAAVAKVFEIGHLVFARLDKSYDKVCKPVFKTGDTVRLPKVSL